VGATLADLAEGATVATGSVRRQAQLRRVRPDLCFAELRGNIDRRLSKVPDDGAIVMAVAALQILGMTERITEVLDATEFVPAVGQGCVAVECRSDDQRSIEALAAIDHPATRHEVEVERAFLAELGSGCSLPVGAHVRDATLWTFLADLDTGRSISEQIELPGGVDDLDVARRAARDAHAALA
jgi:hydroxymethylbilane synthase